MFVGRESELARLKGLWKRKVASFVVIKGRRRIGKSRLAEEFATGTRFISLSGLAPSKGISTQTQRDEFARQMGRAFQIPTPYSKDWGDLFWHLAHHTQTGKVVILLDEISWMGGKDKTFLAKLKTAWDQQLKKNPNLILIVCGSVSAWIEKNIISHTGFVGRLDLVFHLEELALGDCTKFWGSQGKNISAHEKFKVLSVTGGVPKYLEGMNPSMSSDEFIRQSCFTPEGFLFREFDQIFNDLFSKRSGIYAKILQCLVNHQSASLRTILENLNLQKSGVYSQYLDHLVLSGFVSRHHSWNLRNGEDTKQVQFRLSDNYLRFYLKYIAPNKAKIQRGGFQERSITTLPGFEAMMGFQFENLVIRNKALLYKSLGIHPEDIINEGPYFQRSSKKRAGCQINYLIHTKFNSLYLCEIKFLKNLVGTSVIKEVDQKIKALDSEKSFSVRPILIHVNGIEDTVIEEGFFAETVQFSDFLEPGLPRA